MCFKANGMKRSCAFPDCRSPTVAKGLCAKHNMRLRRRGDPAKVGRPGRKDGDAALREIMGDISDRSYARYKLGLRRLNYFEPDVATAVAMCARPNGSMNWAKFERVTEYMAAQRWVQQYPDGA
jgi:hypothetical protein